jgi:hypothetical protein
LRAAVSIAVTVPGKLVWFGLVARTARPSHAHRAFVRIPLEGLLVVAVPAAAAAEANRGSGSSERCSPLLILGA